jgi:thioredoxin-dependent peroxiredoxin
LADYRDRYQAIRTAGALLVAVSVDRTAQSERLRRDLQLPFPLLSDVDRRVVRQWGVFNGRERGGIARPSVFIVDARPRILFESLDGVRSRVPASEIVNVLQAPEGNAGSTKFAYTPTLSEIILAIRNNIRAIR